MATWNTINAFFSVIRRRDAIDSVTPSVRSEGNRSTLVAVKAGARPQAMPVIPETAIANVKTRASMETSMATGRSIVRSSRTAHHARTQPAAPPRHDNSRLSVSSCRTS